MEAAANSEGNTDKKEDLKNLDDVGPSKDREEKEAPS